MKLFTLNKNTMTLIFICALVISFFVAGLLDVLDYAIIKALLFLTFTAIVVLAIHYASKNDIKKNRPKDELQDDSH